MSGRSLPEGAPASRQVAHQRRNRAAGMCRASASHGPAVKGGRCASCYLKDNPDPKAPRRAVARAVVGVSIRGLLHRPFRDRDEAGAVCGTLHAPVLLLSDGSLLTFAVEQGRRGFGVKVLRTPPPKPRRTRG